MKPYYKLRGKLAERDGAKALAKILERSPMYISKVLTAKKGKYFNLDEAFKIMDYINEPYENMYIYFSPQQRKGLEESI